MKEEFPRIAVREVHLEQFQGDMEGLDGCSLALIVFRCRGAVVGQARLPVIDGRIAFAQLKASLKNMAWLVWKQFMATKPEPLKPALTASVVVCTRNRTADLAECLPGLSQIAKQGYQVLVVDNCPSDDSTARLVGEYPKITYLFEARPGLDIARNRGLLAAAGEIVAFIDDDARPDAGWLAALLQNFEDPIAAVVSGITMPWELETKAQQWFESTNSFARGFERRQYDASTISVFATGRVGAGVNMAIRKSVIEEIGWFDEALDGGTLTLSGGDQEFFYRVLAHGYRIVYEPSALVWHKHRREWSELRNTIFGYGVGVFAWWTRALLVEKELTLLYWVPLWFWQHHVGNLFRAIFRRPGHEPLDLAWAEFCGALAGPLRYLRSRRLATDQAKGILPCQEFGAVSDQTEMESSGVLVGATPSNVTLSSQSSGLGVK